MNKRILPALLAGLCVLGLAALAAQAPVPAVHISKIQVQTGTLSTKLVMETDGPLAVAKAYYQAGSPRTLVLDLPGASTSAAPAGTSSGLVRDVQVEKSGADGLRLLVRLSERVPARIVHGSARTVVELNAIQRGQSGYTVDAATQAELDARAKSEILLNRVDATTGPDSLAVKAALTGPAVTQVFALENPPRLVVDLFDTLLAAKSDVWPINDPRSTVQRVRVAQFQSSGPRPITRMVFDLKEPGLYAMDARNDGLVVSFFPIAAAPAAVVQPAPPAASAPLPAPAKSEPAPAKPEPAPARVEPKAAAKTVPVETICPPTPAREAAPPAQDVQVASTQEQFKPKIIIGDEEKYSGDVISMKLKDSDLRDVVLYLADIAGLNVVFDPEVRGTVTVNLQDVPWDQALDIILKQNKMGKSIEGNILRIAPVSVLTREEEEQRRLKESKELSGPVMVKTITLSYSKAQDVASLLRSKVSARGEIIVDVRTNTLLISEVRDKLDLLEKLITVVDTPTPQVSIEARVVEASTTFVRNLGIQWGFRGEASQYLRQRHQPSVPQQRPRRRRHDPPGHRHQGHRRAARRLRHQPPRPGL